jgi:hypothetical protein
VKHLTALSLAAATVLSACADRPPTPLEPSLAVSGAAGRHAHVTTAADQGDGSFRAAVETANADPSITRISFERGLGTVAITEPVSFTGSQAITIDGSGAVLDGAGLAAGESALVASGGGNLEVRDLTVRNAPGSGIAIEIPAASTGTLEFALIGVTAWGNGLHGAVINDQVDPGDTDNEAGSAAGLRVRVVGCRFESNGFGAGDQDGLRVNEGGPGSLTAEIRETVVTANGGDGIELDERGPGDVSFDVQHTRLTRNGAFDPADLDDGMDVDEAQDGSVIGRFVQVVASDNYEEGLDINENHAGDMRIEMNQVEASRNREEGVDLEEDDDFAGGGDLVAVLVNVTASGNTGGDAGIKIRERGDGGVSSTIVNPVTNANAEAGISVREDAAGSLDASIIGALADGNGSHGIIYDENAAGDLNALLRATTSSNNGASGVRAEQATPGAGILRIQAFTAPGNAGGEISSSGVTIDRVP